MKIRSEQAPGEAMAARVIGGGVGQWMVQPVLAGEELEEHDRLETEPRPVERAVGTLSNLSLFTQRTQ